MKSVIFQHPSVVSRLTGRGEKKLETVREVVHVVGGGELGGSLCQKLNDDTGFNCSICTAYREIIERKREDKSRVII